MLDRQDQQDPLATAGRMSQVRWRIFAFLFGFGFIAYFQQKSITVAAERMMPELQFSQQQIGWIMQAFVIGYALFQLPGGLLGQKLGARAAFTLISLVAFLAMMGTALAPALVAGTTLFLALIGAQLLLGLAQGGIFPISAGVFESWFPPRHWAWVQGLQSMGLQAGAAMTPLLIAPLMTTYSWQQAIEFTTLPVLLVIAGWCWYARNTPRDHPGVLPAELAEIGDRTGEQIHRQSIISRLGTVLRSRHVPLLFLSYLFMNYTFYLLANWVFLYLVQQRHFSVLESSWLASAPPLAAAAGAGLGGWLTGHACRRYGTRWGYRLVPILALPAAGFLLLVAVNSTNAYLAVILLALCYGLVELTEGSYWGSAMNIGRGDSMMVCGVMNTGGNLGGIIGIPVVAYWSGHQRWDVAIWIGAILAVLGAAAWLIINADHLSPEIAGQRQTAAKESSDVRI